MVLRRHPLRPARRGASLRRRQPQAAAGKGGLALFILQYRVILLVEDNLLLTWMVYRVGLVVCHLGWVDIDFGHSSGSAWADGNTAESARQDGKMV